MLNYKRLVTGLLVSSGIAFLAHRRGSLSPGGVAGAIATGTTTLGLGGLSWGGAMVYFFVSSSAFSHYKEREKAQTATEKFSKGNRRDLKQVAANGGIATLCAVGYGFTPSPAVRAALEAGYIGALATATADTWATELGVLSSSTPRLITTGQPITKGTSGGITPLGTIAAAGGAFSLGSLFRLFQPRTSWLLAPIALLSGLAAVSLTACSALPVRPCTIAPIARVKPNDVSIPAALPLVHFVASHG